MTKEPGEPKEEKLEDLSEIELAEKINNLKDEIEGSNDAVAEIALAELELDDPLSKKLWKENKDLRLNIDKCLDAYRKRTGKEYVFAKA